MSERFGDDELRAAYAQRDAHGARDDAPAAAHRPDCPSPDALLAAVRGESPRAERLDVLDRALRCPACRREMALLHAVSEPPTRASAARGAWTARRFVPLAAAASVLVVVGALGIGRWRAREGEILRGAGGEPALVTPAAQAPVTGDSARFVWRAVPGAFRYTLEVDAADGTVLHTASTADTTLVVPLGTLAPGEHRWSVRARLDDGSERRSESRPLRVPPR
jgi:hypothetical protein